VGGRGRWGWLELQGKTQRKERNPSVDGEKEEQGKTHSSKGTVSPLFLSNATTVLSDSNEEFTPPNPSSILAQTDHQLHRNPKWIEGKRHWPHV